MFRKRIKQVIAMSLCAAMCLTAVPVSAEEKADTQTSGITADQTEIQQDSTTDGQETNQNISGETVQSETEVEDTVQVEKEDPQVSGDSQTVGMEDDQTADVGTLQSQEQTEESSAETQSQAEAQKEINVPHIIYQSQVQLDGWQSEVQDGATSGTVGEFKRMESVRVRLEDQPYEGNVEYRAHVQNLGWESVWAKNGELSGTVGKALRMEAIQIRLTGEMADHYDIYYRVHAQQFGWLGWAKNGESAGTESFSYRLEGIQIVLVEKGSPAPGSTDQAFWRRPTVKYQSHVQDLGWQSEAKNGGTSGTVGKSKRLESVKIRLDDLEYSGDIEYRSHIQNIGWESSWKKNGVLSGTTGKSLRLEAIQIRLTGEMSKYFDVYYRVHAQQYGWLGWAKNGASAGTEGCSYRLEAVQIRLVVKGAAAPGSTSRAFVKSKNGWYYENGYKFYYKSGVRQTDIRSIIGKQSSYLIKINKQMSCVTVYAKDGNKGYIVPVVAFACSPGAGTPIGTFHTSNKYRWHALFGAQGQWCTRITGHVLFHSLPYTSFNNRTMMPNQYNRLGTWASSGCIRLRAIDAKWIYDNCASGTTVTIYNSSAAGPLGKPVYAKIPAYQNWDPTDPTI